MADQRIQSTEEMVGAGHATKADTLNRLQVVEHNNDGAHKNGVGQCRLNFASVTQIRLDPFDGNQLTINGARQTIPSAGVLLGNGGLAAATLYYIYAFMVGSVVTLEASTTTHVADAATGVRVKSGDATRTLVGMVRTDASSQFSDSDGARLVVSYFNRRPLRLQRFFSAARLTTSSSYVELNAEIAIDFLVWGDGSLRYAATGTGNNSLASGNISTSIGIDGTVAHDVESRAESSQANDEVPFALSIFDSTLSEGHHVARLLGRVTAGGTGTWNGGATEGSRCAVWAEIEG